MQWIFIDDTIIDNAKLRWHKSNYCKFTKKDNLYFNAISQIVVKCALVGSILHSHTHGGFYHGRIENKKTRK